MAEEDLEEAKILTLGYTAPYARIDSDERGGAEYRYVE